MSISFYKCFLTLSDPVYKRLKLDSYKLEKKRKQKSPGLFPVFISFAWYRYPKNQKSIFNFPNLFYILY